MANSPRRSTSSDTSLEELSPALLETIQETIVATIREKLTTLAPTCVATPSDVGALEEGPTQLAPAPFVTEGLDTLMQSQSGDAFPQWLARLECLQKGLSDVQYQVMRAPL
ncbi:UNVERIFIED_CONTAM: hypothetical protein Sradi_3984600 [Sesamum radiatum]|uniref:Uncharacterized protein n=1 Tax=Sesamum radiatum TaxID=300843 RepID=A0AAW2PJW9_SESRA